MSKNTRPGLGKEDGPYALLKLAEDEVAWALEELQEAVRAQTAQEDGTGKRVSEATNGLHRSIQALFNERHHLEKFHGTGVGEPGVDFDKARAEIGRRLDRLRSENGAGGVSEGSE
jgi:hypothetical protein